MSGLFIYTQVGLELYSYHKRDCAVPWEDAILTKQLVHNRGAWMWYKCPVK